jgi:hypothetical protein
MRLAIPESGASVLIVGCTGRVARWLCNSLLTRLSTMIDNDDISTTLAEVLGRIICCQSDQRA